jgi:hypothetical protein
MIAPARAAAAAKANAKAIAAAAARRNSRIVFGQCRAGIRRSGTLPLVAGQNDPHDIRQAAGAKFFHNVRAVNFDCSNRDSLRFSAWNEICSNTGKKQNLSKERP